MFASIEQRYGVPPGPLIAIWGMETGFGSQRGNQNMLSSIATLAYDCRRPEYFTDQLYAALKLIDRGVLSAGTRGSMHGEIGQTQFMPKSILAYGTGNLDVAANALTSTANFLKAHGWRAGAGYQPGEAQFRRDPGVERRWRLSAGDRADGAADRRLGRVRGALMRPSGPYVFRTPPAFSSVQGGSGLRYPTRQQMQMPSPTSGYFSATTAAAPKKHNVVSERTRIILRTFGGILPPGVRSISSQTRAM